MDFYNFINTDHLIEMNLKKELNLSQQRYLLQL